MQKLRELGDWRNSADVMAAGKIAVKRLAGYFDGGVTFNQETTLYGIEEQDIEGRYMDTFHNLRIILPESDLAVFYDNTMEFHRFAIYKSGKPVRVSAVIPMWYERFAAECEVARK